VVPAVAAAHPERTTVFPDYRLGEVPTYGTKGPSHVVCKRDSLMRIKRIWAGTGPRRTRMRAQRLALLKRCRFRDIQAAVEAASNGDRILILPGVYREERSRGVPVNDPKCAGRSYWEPTNDGHGDNGMVPRYRFQLECPLSRNLIAIIGDTNGDRRCDRRCGLQIEGMGRTARDVLIEGDRRKRDVIRADRADGIQLLNLTIEQAAFNNVDVVETNGFRLRELVVRYGQNYGVLTFTSDNGVYEDIEAYGNGDSGIYPGSGPEGGCRRFGIEIRRVNSYGNVLGYSGTAGNGTWTHDSRFHGNAVGVADDSFASGHPGMPQDCSKWTRNEINSNNVNFFSRNRSYCNATPFERRRKDVVCPQFQVPVGSGLILYGANRNRIANNHIWDNWRSGVRLFYVPAAVRGDLDPRRQFDTSNGNRFEDNRMGLTPAGRADPNGSDFTWDEQGIGNCWQGNRSPKGRAITSDPASLPTCDSGGSKSVVPNLLKAAAEVPCASWNPRTNPDPPGCAWFITPPEPR
jgi:hypothetical protein